MSHTNPIITDPRIRKAVASEMVSARRIHRQVIALNPLTTDMSRIAAKSYHNGLLNGIRYAAENISMYLSGMKKD